jgi:RNA polymerase sigma-70 factor (ECF subfamily)
MDRAAVEALLGQLLRRDHARLVAALTHRTGDLQLAEDALSDAVLAAVRQWPVQGVPERPLGWLLTVGVRRAIDRRRKEGRETDLVGEPAANEATDDAGGIPDERLRLVFGVCHPALRPRAQVALALTALGGISTTEVARAFLEAPATTARRLSRARLQLREQRVRFELPGPSQLAERLSAVLATVYLIFNEGYASSSSAAFVRVDLCAEAIRLAALVAELLPGEPEAAGLWALLRLHHARRAARVDAAGQLVPLEEQDRSRWDRVAIHRAQEDLGRALTLRRPGPYQIQAAIAALHAVAERSADTDWPQIAGLYGALLRHTPTPVVELNAAIALAMSKGPRHGLDWLASLRRRGLLAGWHLLPAAEADLLRRSGRGLEAIEQYDAAMLLAPHPAEREYLRRRRRQLADELPLQPARPGHRRRREVRDDLVVRPLPDELWARAAPHLVHRKARGRPPGDDRALFTLVLAVLASGRPWREIPAALAPWRTVYHRFRAWERSGELRSALLAIDAPAEVWASLAR